MQNHNLLKCNKIWPGTKIRVIKTLCAVHPLFVFQPSCVREQSFPIKTPPSPFELSASKSHFWHSLHFFFQSYRSLLFGNALHARTSEQRTTVFLGCVKEDTELQQQEKRLSTFPDYTWRQDRTRYQETGLQAGRPPPLHSTSSGSLHLIGGQHVGAVLQSHTGHEP